MALTTNKNFFSNIQAEFFVRRLPNVRFFCQGVKIPGMSLGIASQPTPFSEIKIPGDHISFNELEVRFLVDEYMENYLELAEWMIRNGFPTSYEEYQRHPTTAWTDEGKTSDGSILFLDSKGNPKLECVVSDLFPVTLSDVDVDTTQREVDYLPAKVGFAYTTYRIQRLA